MFAGLELDMDEQPIICQYGPKLVLNLCTNIVSKHDSATFIVQSDETERKGNPPFFLHIVCSPIFHPYSRMWFEDTYL